MTPLLGRDESLIELRHRVDANRLVTITGPGGVGKTRLLTELGAQLMVNRPDHPVVWCELVQADAASAPEVVATALGIDGRPGVPPVDRILEVLGDDAVVLLLDNCEHVLDPVAELVRTLIAGCPHVQIVATSRERLRVAGEQLCPLRPLSTAGEQSPAVDLFVQRAGAVSPDFAADGDARAEVVRIVERLDGLPLAIELAAARLHTLGLDEVASGLDRRFDLLSLGYRASTRHSSLAAAISWSFDSLDAPLQECFSALSVFARPFTLPDAAAVCADAGATDRMLADLVEQSLLQRDAGGRYSMLETLRAYGAEQLVASDQEAEVRERHARWMVDWIERADRSLSEPGGPVLSEIDHALPELRQALTWLVGHGLLDHAGRLVAGLVDYGILRLRPDVLGWADRVLEVDADEPNRRTAVLLAASAYSAWMAGDLDASAALAQRAVAATRSGVGLPDPRAQIVRGNVALFEGRLDEAAEWYEDAIECCADETAASRRFARATLLLARGYAGDPRAGALADELLREVDGLETPLSAYVWYCAGEADLALDLHRATSRLATAIRIADATNASFVKGVAGASKASIAARSGDPELAIVDYRWLIEHWRRAGMWATQWTMLRSVAALLARVGRFHDAAVLEGAVRATRDGHRIFGADAVALAELGELLRAELGDESYEEAVATGGRLDGAGAVDWALRAL